MKSIPYISTAYGIIIFFTLQLIQPPPLKGQEVRINEIMSLNGSFISDEDGMFEDWIELHNSGEHIINLEGYGLSDDDTNPFKWVFPSYEMQPGDYLMIWASGKDRKAVPGQMQNGIMRLFYADIPGTRISNLINSATFPNQPTRKEVLTNGFEAPFDVADNYGQHLYTWIKAPQTGNYTFYISSDDNSELYVSTDSSKENAALIAYVKEWTSRMVWDKYPEQKSAPVFLTEGEMYYVSVLMKEGDGGDNLTLRWDLPDNTIEAPIHIRHCFIPLGDFHTNFNIASEGEPILLTHPDGEIIDWFDPVFIPLNASYGRFSGSESEKLYFKNPTPGAANTSAVYAGVTPRPSVTPQSGVFRNAVIVEMSSEDPLAEIYYTLNGTVPSATNGMLYHAPFPLANTSLLRVVAISPGNLNSDIISRTLSVVHADLSDFTSNLPVMIIHTFDQPITDWQKTPAYMVLQESRDDGWYELSNQTTFSGRINIEIRGSSSKGFPKRGYGFHIVEEDGRNRKVPLLGLPQEHNWVLHGPFADKSLMRNALSYKMGEDAGHYAPRTRFVELFIHSLTNPLRMEHYAGVYLLVERIKVAPGRVEIEELEPYHNTWPDVSGGYIFKYDRLNAGESGFRTPRNSLFAFVRPDETTATPQQKQYITSYVDSLENALFSSSFTNRQTGYARYLDARSFIDLHLITELAKEIDGYRLSTFFYKDRQGKLIAGPLWDFNLSLGNANYNDGWNPQGWYYPLISDRDYTYGWFRRLFQDPAFSAQYRRRYRSLRQNAFSEVNLLQNIQHNSKLLEEAQVRNFEKWKILGTYVWPNWYIAKTWEEEMNWMTNWLMQRLIWMDSQLGQPYVMIHYWNFNQQTMMQPSWSLNPADITIEGISPYNISSATGQNFSGINARLQDPAASHLRLNTPSQGEIIIPVSSLKYKNLLFSYEASRSNNGPNRHYISYSVNGSDFIAFDTLIIKPTPHLMYVDLAPVTATSNNANLKIKIIIGYDASDAGGTTGNNRIDNIALDGEQMSGVIRPPRMIAPLKEHIELIAKSSSFVLRFSDYFISPDNQPLTYTIKNHNPDVLAVSVAGNQHILLPLKAGGATFEFEVSDGTNPPIKKKIYILVYPQAVPLATKGYIFNLWSPHEPEGNFPPHMVFLQGETPDPNTRSPLMYAYSIPADDYAPEDQANIGFPYRNLSRSRINGLNYNGISFINTGRSRDVGAAVLAIDTRGIDHFIFTWKASTVRAGSRVYNLRLQYRVGINKEWKNWYLANGSLVEYERATTGHSTTFVEIPLPQEAVNQPYVQIRWLYYHTGEQLIADNGARDMLALNYIGINESTSVETFMPYYAASILQVWPNPVKDHNIRFNMNTSGQLMDVQGRVIGHLYNNNQMPAPTVAGLYFFRSIAGETIKIIID
jgi:hypothetical protein